MNNSSLFEFPHLGVEIEIPDHLTIRQYSPPPMNKLNSGTGKFTPYRMVIDFDIFDRAKNTREKTSVELRVYFTKAEYIINSETRDLKLAFWNIKLNPPDWEIIIPSNIVVLPAPLWTGRGISYYGYIEASHQQWGDPPVALGE